MWRSLRASTLSASTSLCLPPQAILLSESHFLTIDGEQGVLVYTYDGRQVSNPRFNGLRAELLNRRTVALSRDCVAIVDTADPKAVRCFDLATGKAIAAPIVHRSDVARIALNQAAQGMQVAHPLPLP